MDLNKKLNTSEIISFFKDLLIIIIIVVIIRTFVAMPFQISGQSMYSSYYDREFIIVDRLSYYFSDPDRGDVVVFEPNLGNDKKYFLKRIIGVPGDVIRIEGGEVYVKPEGTDDFVELKEDYLNVENNGYTYVGTNRELVEYNLGEDQYFVLGDNRNHSTDSRECFSSCRDREEFISESDIVGKLIVDLGYFNFKRFGFIQPNLGIETTPRFFSSPSTFDYDNL